MKFLTDFTYRNLHGFARFPGDSMALVFDEMAFQCEKNVPTPWNNWLSYTLFSHILYADIPWSTHSCRCSKQVNFTSIGGLHLTLWPLRSFPIILLAYASALLHYAEYSCYVAAVVRWFVSQLHYKTSLTHAAHYMRDDYRRPSRSLC